MSILFAGVSVFAEDTKHDEASEYITLAISAFYEDKYDLALDYCNKAINIIPEPTFYSLKSKILNYQENYVEAIDALDQALTISPEYGPAYTEKALIYSKLNKFDEFLNCLDQGITAAPGHIPLYMYKAMYLTEVDKNDEAIECYKLGVKNNPKELSLYSQLSYQLFKTGRNDEIIDCLSKIIELNPNNEEALYNIACAYSLLDKPNEALLYLKKSIELSPKNKTLAITDPELANIRTLDGFSALSGVGVYVDGKFLEFDVPPTIEEGRVLLPLRLVFETLNASVEWIDSTKTVKGQMGDITVSLQIGSKTAVVNGAEVKLDVPGKIVNGRTLVPLRFVSESFGADVKWDQDTKTVYVTSADKNTNTTDLSKEDIIEELNASVDILPVDGIFPEPYGLDAKEAKMILVAKSAEDLKLFNSLSKKDKIDYLNNSVQENYGAVLACETIEASFVFDGKMYYRLNTSYDAISEDLELETFKLGMPVNVIEQDFENFTYRYYYSN